MRTYSETIRDEVAIRIGVDERLYARAARIQDYEQLFQLENSLINEYKTLREVCGLDINYRPKSAFIIDPQTEDQFKDLDADDPLHLKLRLTAVRKHRYLILNIIDDYKEHLKDSAVSVNEFMSKQSDRYDRLLEIETLYESMIADLDRPVVRWLSASINL